MKLTHRQIETFRAVMASGSVTSAASVLHTSQPTVSRELARLEEVLGFLLFDRLRGRLVPTARGLSLFEEVQRSYSGLEKIASTAKGLARFEGGQLSVACVPALSHALLPSACKRFIATMKEARISVFPEESPLLEEWLSAQQYDLGLTERAIAPAGTRLTRLLDADEVCVLPPDHTLLNKPKLTPEDFANQRFVSLSPADPYRQLVDRTFEERGIPRRMALDTSSAVSVCSMVKAGIGLAIVNPLTALAFEGSVALRPFSISIPFRVSVVTPEHRPRSPLVEPFKAALWGEAKSLQNRLRAINVPATVWPGQQ